MQFVDRRVITLQDFARENSGANMQKIGRLNSNRSSLKDPWASSQRFFGAAAIFAMLTAIACGWVAAGMMG
jgi:hypothetical protein